MCLVISFGVAPAVIGFSVGLQGFWDLLILLYFVNCGVARLARFNATVGNTKDASGKIYYFEGTPIRNDNKKLYQLTISDNSIHCVYYLLFGTSWDDWR